MNEQGPQPGNPEPFREPLEHLRQGGISELRKFVGDDRYIVRVEPYQDDQDYAAFNQALLKFGQQTGLAMVPHADVIGMARYDNQNAPEIGEPNEAGAYKAIFHVAKKVNGQRALDHNLANLQIPQVEAAKLLDGIVKYHVDSRTLDL